MDLTKLSDKELIELKKQIIAEQENRKDNISYKDNIRFDPETGMPVGYITVREAAKRCGVTYMAIAKRVERGTAESIKLGVSVFIKEDSLNLHAKRGRRAK